MKILAEIEKEDIIACLQTELGREDVHSFIMDLDYKMGNIDFTVSLIKSLIRGILADLDDGQKKSLLEDVKEIIGYKINFHQ